MSIFLKEMFSNWYHLPGSAADLCELKVKDEILRVNQVNVTDKTAGEVGDVIGRSVSTGYIELKVKRMCHAGKLDFKQCY